MEAKSRKPLLWVCLLAGMTAGMLLAFLAPAPEAEAQTAARVAPGVFQGGQIVGFNEAIYYVNGSPRTYNVAYQRQKYAGSRWVFRTNGTFTFTKPGYTYPVSGRYIVRRGVTSFYGERTANFGNNGYTVIEMGGTIARNRNGRIIARVLEEIQAQTNSCVNGFCYGQSQYKYSDFFLTMGRLR